MALSVFEDKASRPSHEDVATAVGETKVLWEAIVGYIEKAYGSCTEEWKHYGKASGWTLLLKLKKRTILYLFPQSGFFVVQFVYGEKAVQKALGSDLPEVIVGRIKEAPFYVEGRSFRVDVKCQADVNWIMKLVDIKMKT
jgi:hypothetical protein